MPGNETSNGLRDFGEVLSDPRPKRMVVYVEFDLPDGEIEVTVAKSGLAFSEEGSASVKSTMARMVAVIVEQME